MQQLIESDFIYGDSSIAIGFYALAATLKALLQLFFKFITNKAQYTHYLVLGRYRPLVFEQKRV